MFTDVTTSSPTPPTTSASRSEGFSLTGKMSTSTTPQTSAPQEKLTNNSSTSTPINHQIILTDSPQNVFAAIIGAIVGGVFALILIDLLVICLCHKKKKPEISEE